MESKVREIIVSSAGIFVAVCCLISFYICFFGKSDYTTAQYLITKLVSIPVSLYSTLALVKFINRRKISATTRGKITIALIYLLSFLFSSLMLVANVILYAMHIIRIVTNHDHRAAEAKRSTDESHKMIYMRSEARAIARILSENDSGDIMLDDGVNLTRYRQIALIDLDGERYALLSPYRKSHLVASSAHIYLIGTYPDTGAPSLSLITDDGLYDRVYTQYKLLFETEHH